mgnify:CR=1 FL=1
MRGALLPLALLAAPAQAEGCRLALVLALDVSSSVDAEEDRLQREGLAAAMLAPAVARAFLQGEPVALFAFEWSGRNAQVPLWDGWRVIEDEEALRRAAGAVAKSRRSRDELPTALGAALGFAASALEDGPDCRSRTIDVSGDGINNEGFSPDLAREFFPLEGVTVNALLVGGEGEGEDLALLSWFQEEVLSGPGAFVVRAQGYAQYEEAMKVKLLRELMVPAVSGRVVGPEAG